MSYRCNKCGHELSDEAQFCPVCGEVQPKRKTKETEVAKKAKGKVKKIAPLLIALLALGSGSIVYSNQRALHPMPDLVDMDVREAISILDQGGIDDDHITFVDNTGGETEKENDWIVVEQEPSAGSQINVNSDEVVLTIFDQLSCEADQSADCEGGKR